VDLDGKEKQLLAAPMGWAAHGQLSPDGKRLLVCREGGLAVVNFGEPETLTPVAGGPDELIERWEFDWSPDGKRNVFRRQKGTIQERGDVELVVADPDGKNATVIRKANADGIWKVYWRLATPGTSLHNSLPGPATRSAFRQPDRQRRQRLTDPQGTGSSIQF
jgi:hypothetical protein